MKETNIKVWVGVIALIFVSIVPAAASPTLTVIHQFLGGTDGNEPNSLIQASDGNFYGTTYLSRGTVFKVTPDGQFTTLFLLPSTVYRSDRFFYGDFFTGVVEGPDGFLYVTVRGGNNNPNPMLFRISKSGTDFQVVLQEAPYGLSAASDGNLYGADGNGMFRLSTSGTYTVLFSSGTGGITPYGFGKQASDGNFYGGCSVASISGPTHVCRVTTSGVVTPIFQYPIESDGYALFPASGLTQGPDGFLYGVGVGGPGSISYQVIFQLSLSGRYREIYRINQYCTPKTGCSRVLPASDGNLWIADPPQEAVYSVTTSGTLLQTVSFSSQPNRYAHPNLLLQDKSSGILFGTTGEPNPAFYDTGSVFSLDAGLPPPR